jgi:hypothetical protein
MAVADLQPVYGDWWGSTPSPSGVMYFGIHSLNGIGPPPDEIHIMPVELAGLTVISTELPNMGSRADRAACTELAQRFAGVPGAWCHAEVCGGCFPVVSCYSAAYTLDSAAFNLRLG